jgi:hypothetical protein
VPPHESARASLVIDLLGRVSGRLRLEAWLMAIAAALAAGALTWVTASVAVSVGGVRALSALGVGLMVLAWRLGTRRHVWSPHAAARAIERAVPASRNVVFTAEELLRHPDRVRPSIRQRVFEDAGRVSDDVKADVVVPVTRAVVGAVTALVVMTLLVYAVPLRQPAGAASKRGDTAVGESEGQGVRIRATIRAPGYIGGAPRVFENPERLEALEGSHLELNVRGPGDWRVRFGSRTLDRRGTAEGLSVAMTLTQGGYLAIEPIGPSQENQRRLIPLVVSPDRAPTIRIETPGRDLLIPDAKRVVAVGAVATDDYGLAMLELRYTRISGSGEQFEFTEGIVPLNIARPNDRSWKAGADLAIARLGLTSGDSLVYRVVGRDRRPDDAGLASSDTFFVEVAGPGQVALEGFELPPDRERYALSQQMIVLKLERLRARERSLDRATLEHEVANLAAEQRAVRTNFVFLTGGTVEDEEEEAEHSHEIQEGRLENTARREITRAIQHMTRAEQAMGAVNTAEALPPARAAVEALQRAFGRNRYFLRTAPVRSRVDPSRRLTGNLSEAASWRRELFAASEAGTTARARVLLARLIELSPQMQRAGLPAAALTAFAEEALSIDAASRDWQEISKTLSELRDGRGATAADRERSIQQAAGSIAAIIRRSSPAATPRDTPADALRSAWRDAAGRK